MGTSASVTPTITLIASLISLANASRGVREGFPVPGVLFIKELNFLLMDSAVQAE
jgi:hypothetical protein